MKNLSNINRKITLNQLRAFVAVARTRSFTRAAELLLSSQPSVSSAIQQLEAELSLKLFDRTTKELYLTAEGKVSLPIIERLIDDLDTELEDLRATAERRRGSVAIAVVPSVASNIIPQTIAAFSKAHPNIRISLADDNTPGVWDRVRAGEVDFGVAGLFNADEGLKFEVLLRDPFGAVLRSDHPLSKDRGPITWDELRAYPFITMGSNTGIKPLVDMAMSGPSNVASPMIEGSNIATVIALLKEGLGVTALPELSVRSEGSNLVFRELIDPPLGRELGLITRGGRGLSPAAETLLKFLKNTLETL